MKNFCRGFPPEYLPLTILDGGMGLKKTGILTFHCADNYGAVLQAYALMKEIQNLGHEVEIIDFRPSVIVDFYQNKSISIRESVSRVGLYKTARRWISYKLRSKTIASRLKNFDSFRREYLSISKEKYRSFEELKGANWDFDYLVTGSDQVWNPDFFMPTGGAYFLDFGGKNVKRVSYAPSIARDVEELHYEYYVDYLKNFDHISVRERSAERLLSKLTDKPITVALDPTLLLKADDWDRISSTKNAVDKYVLVYDLIKDPTTVTLANNVAKEYGLKIISYGSRRGYHNWSRSFEGAHPKEFLALFRDAEFIVTSSFHGTAFSIIYNKPFYTVPHPVRGSRMIDLLRVLGLGSRIITNPEISVTKIDFGEANNRLGALRARSKDFLREALC